MRKIFTGRSTFVTVIAAAALLVVAGGGGAVAGGLITSAKIKNNTVQSIDVRNNTLRGIDVLNNSLTGTDIKDFSLSNEDIGVLTASVNADGTLGTGTFGVTSSSTGVGTYSVDFGRDIAQCAFVGNVAHLGTGSATGMLSVADRSGNAEAVFVNTRDTAGASANRAFHLVVVC